jgi:hypothetical protein
MKFLRSSAALAAPVTAALSGLWAWRRLTRGARVSLRVAL